MKTINQGSIRAQNTIRLWEALQKRGQATRQMLMQDTGLSLMTVGNLVDLLMQNGALHEMAIEPKSKHIPGRKATLLAPDEQKVSWLMLNLTSRRFGCTVFSANAQPGTHLAPFPYSDEFSYMENLTVFLGGVRAMLSALPQLPLGTAVVVPGPYRVDCDTVLNMRIPELNQIKIKETLHNELGNMNYYVDEDVKFAVRAFMPHHLMGTEEPLFYLYIGEGVGGAILHDGTVLRGLNAVAGDAGQLRCGQGNYEQVLCLNAFAKRLGAAQNAGEEQTLAAIENCAQQHHELYIAALDEAAHAIADMMQGIRWILDPSVLVIDCAYAAFDKERFICMLKDKMRDLTPSVMPELPTVLLAQADQPSLTTGVVRILSSEWIKRIVEENDD